ncbi:acetyltransferase [Vibrio cholerae]|nr:acetyltransferase [Vibrio cholerae]
MVTVVVFEFSVMRCQPLRRALVSLRKIHQKFKLKALKN